jgi:aerotaxis receptor
MKKNLPITDREVEFPDNTNILSTTDLKGQVTYVNQDFITICGFSQDELLGKNHNIVRHPDMPPAAFQSLWDTVQTGNSWMGIVKNRCKNGDHYWVSAYVTPITEDGKVVEYQSVRTRPEPEQIARASQLYARLSAGKGFKPSLASRIRLPWRLLGAGVLATLAALGLHHSGVAGTDGTAAIVVAAMLASLLSMLIIQPIHQVIEQTRTSVSNDALARRIYTGRDDEAGQLQFALFRLRSEARAIAGRINDCAEQLGQNAERLASAVERSSQGLNHQQSETEQIASAITEMVASIEEVARHAQMTAVSAEGSNTCASNGQAVMADAREAILSLTDEIENATGVIDQLATSSDNIHGILEVITGISEKTNLLALNAAIEAARAGEHGRGFAVVAEEVRNLAQRSQESVGEIQTLLESLQQGSRNATDAMRQSQNKARHTVERALQAADALQEITVAVNQITDMNTQIASAVEQQLSVSGEIERNVGLIRDVAQNNLSDGEQTQLSAEEMAGLSRNLKQLSTNFWVVKA